VTAASGVIAGLADKILQLPGWLVLSLVFLFPALEASAFVGFVFPGEIAVILGGVAAFRGTVSLWAVIVAAVSGAIIGDSVGYVIGRRWGDRLLVGTLGRLPVIRRNLDKHLESARAYVRRRRGSAVFFGRFTTALRVLVPGLAGISGVEYPAFLAYNVAGGAAWGTGIAVLGYLAGASYKHLEKVLGWVGLGLLALIVIGLALSRLLRRFVSRQKLRAFGDRLAAAPPLAWIRRRFPRLVAWGLRRLAADPRGFWLTFTVAVGGFAAWAFGALTQDVLAPDDLALRDPHVTHWLAGHRTGWLTDVARAVAWLGNEAVLIPVVAVGLALLAARSERRAVIRLALATGAAAGLAALTAELVGRARPPATLWIGHYAGPAFPSEGATLAIAVYGMLAVVLAVGRRASKQALLFSAAAVVTLASGAASLYLASNWLTDVLAGWALGALCICAVIAGDVLITTRTKRAAAGQARPIRDASLEGDRRHAA
jgi:membrane protein DedA with SNARE-associated domain/membrane-associated phospholipid phosphatase